MSTSVDLPPQAIRTLVHRKVDEATDAEVAVVHRLLLEIEARRLRAELGEEFASDWASGRLTAEKVAAAVQEHRAKQP